MLYTFVQVHVGVQVRISVFVCNVSFEVFPIGHAVSSTSGFD